jgi:hypothetical protein
VSCGHLKADSLSLRHKSESVLAILPAAITEVSYGQEVLRRIRTAVGLGDHLFGIGTLSALSKSKKHYIGMTWDDGGKKGGIALQSDKNEFRGLLAALEGVSGKKAVNTDRLAK